jgi:hypothetical protein
MGSIIVSRIGVLFSPSLDLNRWRSDDLFKLSDELFFSGGQYGVGDIAGVLFSFILGIVLIYATYFMGVFFSRAISGVPKK